MIEEDRLAVRCKSQRVNPAAPRRAIIHALCQTPAPKDAVDLLQGGRQYCPALSLGTVYRFMRQLESLALVQAHAQPHGRMRWSVAETGSLASAPSSATDGTALARLKALASQLGYRLAPAERAPDSP